MRHVGSSETVWSNISYLRLSVKPNCYTMLNNPRNTDDKSRLNWTRKFCHSDEVNFLLPNFSYRADTSWGDKSWIGVTLPTVTGVVLTGGCRVADKFGPPYCRPVGRTRLGSLSCRLLIIQLLTVSTLPSRRGGCCTWLTLPSMLLHMLLLFYLLF